MQPLDCIRHIGRVSGQTLNEIQPRYIEMGRDEIHDLVAQLLPNNLLSTECAAYFGRHMAKISRGQRIDPIGSAHEAVCRTLFAVGSTATTLQHILELGGNLSIDSLDEDDYEYKTDSLDLSDYTVCSRARSIGEDTALMTFQKLQVPYNVWTDMRYKDEISRLCGKQGVFRENRLEGFAAWTVQKETSHTRRDVTVGSTTVKADLAHLCPDFHMIVRRLGLDQGNDCTHRENASIWLSIHIMQAAQKDDIKTELPVDYPVSLDLHWT